MQRHEIITLVDITETGVTDNNAKDAETQLKRNQQRNYDTLCQVISLRSNFYGASVSCVILDNVKYFDNDITNLISKHNEKTIKMWNFVFETDHTDPFGNNHELLKLDLNQVPIIPALTETVPIFPPYFITDGDLQNTVVRPLRH